MIPLAAAVFAGLTAFVAVGALTGQFAAGYRQSLARATAVAQRQGERSEKRRPSVRILRTDNLARSKLIASQLGRWEWARTRALLLDRADLPLKVSEWLLILAGSFLAAALLVTALSGRLAAGLLFGLAAVIGWEVWLRNRASRRRARFEQQLPWALQAMATSLRAGFGIMEAVATVAREADSPISDEFRRLLETARLGGSFEDGLHDMTERIGSEDLRIVARAMEVHKKVGGNLAAILESVAHTMREREELRGHVRALTAQQRLGGMIVSLLPLWVIGFFLVMDPEFISPLWRDPIGRLLLVIGAAMEAVAFFGMRRILRIEV